jgi:peroxiredoxin
MQGKPVPDFSLPSTGGSIFTLSHLKFPFELLSGADEALCRQFGVIKLKTVPGHVQEVSNFAKAL